MDVCESEKASEKQSTAETTRQPLVSADNKNGTTPRPQTREVSSSYTSPTPSAASGPKHSPSPIVGRNSSTSTLSVPKRAMSVERKRPSTPSSPRNRSPSTPVQDTTAEMLLASRKTISSKMPESLWPSTMRSLGSSFQSDSSSLSSTKRDTTSFHIPFDRTLRPSSNVAHKGEPSSPRKATMERKRSPPEGKSSADQLENSKPVDSLNARQLDQHRKPSRTSGNTFTALNRSDIIDKTDKTSFLTNSEFINPSLRRLSLDGAIKSDITDKKDKTSVLSSSGVVKPSSRRLSLGGTVKSDNTDQKEKMLFLSHSGMVKPSPSSRRLSLSGPIKSDITEKDKTSVLSHSGMVKPSSRRLSLEGTVKIGTTDHMDKMSFSSNSGTDKPSPRITSLDGTVKSATADQMERTSFLSHSGVVKPSPSRLSLDGTSKSDTTDQMENPTFLPHSRIVKPSPKGLSLDGTRKSDSTDQMEKTPFLPHSGIVEPSPRRLSLDGTIKSDTTDKMDKMSFLLHSGTVKPSPRRLSLDGVVQSDTADHTDKALLLSHSGMVKPSPRRLTLDRPVKNDTTDQMDKTSVLIQSGVVKASPRRLSLDVRAIKSDTTDTSPLSGSRSVKSPPRRFSLDEASKPSKKSATDLLMEMSRDNNVKGMLFGRSVDDGLPRIQRPNSSSSSDRASLINAVGTHSLLIPASRPPLLSVSRGMSPSRAKVTLPSSRGTSPSNVRQASPSSQPQSSTSVLSFISDVKKENSAANIEDVHQLRLLYNRHLQWRFANAQAGAALRSQEVKAEKMLYGMWRIIADTWLFIRKKRSNFQQLGLKLELYSILHNQVKSLDEWTSFEVDHMNSLTRLIQNVEASTILIPLNRGTRGDTNSVKAALYSAAHVMQSVGSSLCSGLSNVEEMNCLLAELADVAAHEKAMLNECQSLLSSTDTYKVEECYLRTLIFQMEQGC